MVSWIPPLHGFRELGPALTLVAFVGGCCGNTLPSVTGITLTAADADGNPNPILMARTSLKPPIPLLTVRPGSEPRQAAVAYNHPTTGRIAVRLAVGAQSFLLFTREMETAGPFVAALFLDNEAAPALSVLIGEAARHLEPSPAASIIDLDGKLVPNHSALSAERRGFRIRLERAAFPLPGLRIDVSGPWTLQGDNISDAVGVLRVRVEAAG